MEDWAKNFILQHNTIMQAAYILVCEANGYCSNSQSERLEEELNKYVVLPNDEMKISEPTR